MQKIFYLCDGEKEDCKKRYCYKNGGNCKHTTNIYNARNFQQRNRNVIKSSFYENETASENEDSEESPSVDKLIDEWSEVYQESFRASHGTHEESES